MLSEWCAHVVLTLGSSGALIGSMNDRVYIDPEKVNVVDTTGAGDSFAAGILYGLSQDWNMLDSGKLAARLAAKVISQKGATLTNDEIHSILNPE